ncbi:MAG: riboflavin biosynthesis protein RibD, partial [Candidatus Marinimicrobia bacterium]|nr:riboflavin biosynthesis protein RibD [Candidatus Neomarinimicrobiota bacterium]
MNIHEQYMDRAIYLAQKGRGKVSPNPMVGCIIVKNGKIIGEGFHKHFGGNHAEVEAFKNCIEDPTDASIYITLEPCVHFGKTPPCSNVILENGVRDVYIATIDPNPLMSGKGIDFLEQAGINVQINILNKEADYLNRGYSKWIKTNEPLVIGKIAQDKKGFIGKKGSQIWITGTSSKENVHKLR